MNRELLFDEKYFGSKSELRNRLLADLLSRTEYMERVGTGIQRIRDACGSNGNEVSFSMSDSFFVRIHSNVKRSEKSSEKILSLLKEHKNITISEMSTSLGISTRAVEKVLKKLTEQSLIKRIGGRKEGHWEVRE